MGFSLRNLVEEGVAQLNPFDGGKTAATVRATRPATLPTAAPAKLPNGNLQFSPTAQARIRQRDGARAEDIIAKGANPGDTTPAKPFDWRDAVIPAFKEALPEVGTGISLGALRSLTGTAQGVSGLVDLATPGTGTSRASDWLNGAAENIDQTADAEGVNGIYHATQPVADAAQFLIPGAGFAKVAEYAPKVGKVAEVGGKLVAPVDNVVTKVAENLAERGAAGRIAAKAVDGGLSTPNMINAAAGTGLDLGTQSAKGEDISGADVALSATTNLVGGAALSAAPQAAIEGVRAIKPTTKLVADTTVNTARTVAKARKEALHREAQDTNAATAQRRYDSNRKELMQRLKKGQAAGYPDTHPVQRSIYKSLQQLDETHYNAPQKATRTKTQKVTDRLFTTQPGNSMRRVDSSGKFDPNQPKGKNTKTQKADTPAHEKFHDEYADALRQMDESFTGGQKIPDGEGGYVRTSEHSKFYRDYYAENGRKPSKQAWRDEAKRQLESGKADDSYAQEYYNELKTKAKQSPVPEANLEQIAQADPKSRPQGAAQTEFERAHNSGDKAAEAAAAAKLDDPAMRGESMDPEAKKAMIAKMRGDLADKMSLPAEKSKPETFYRGGGEGSMPRGKTAKDVLDYEQKELGNADVKAVDGVDPSTVKSEDLVWVTKDAAAAEEYGDVSPVELNGHRVVATDGQGGYLIQKNAPKASSAAPAENDIPPTPTPGKGEAVSKFPARVGQEERAQPIRHTIDDLSTHKVKKNDPVMAEAKRRIDANEDDALTFAKQGETTEANATAISLLNKYLDEGAHEKADDLIQAISPRFTRQGQETQILAAYSRLTPAGAVRYASKEVNKVVAKTNKGKQLDPLTDAAHKEIQRNGREIADQIGTELDNGTIGRTSTKKSPKSANNAENVQNKAKTPEEMLAARIKTLDEAKANEPDPIKDMVNTLHKVAKEVLPAKGKAVPRDPMELIGDAVRNKAEYTDVYDKAQKIVMDRYKDNPAALDELQQYFETQISRPFSKSQVNAGVQSGLKGTDLSKIVKEHYTKVDATGADLKQKLIERAGLNESEAGQLSKSIQDRYNQLVSERKDSILKQMFGEKPTREQISAADRILQLHNLGAMSRDELRPLVAKKLGLQTLTPDASKQISDMANGIQELKKGSPERMRKTAEMMKFIEQQKPQSGIDNAVSVWKAGLLSGVKTQQGNAISNGVFRLLKTISDAPATVADKAFSLKTGERTKTFTVAGSGQGAKQGVKSGYATLRTGLDERSFGDKYGQHAEINFKNKTIQKVFGKPSNLVFRGMSAADQPFYYSAFKNSLYDQAKASGVTRGLKGAELKAHMENMVKNPSEALVERATNEARRSVLGYDTFASKAIQFMHKGIDNMEAPEASKKVAKAAVNVLAPFVRVPAAFISRTVDFTPMGLPKQIFHQVADGKFDQRAMAQAIGEATTGTAVLALGAALGKQGLISGAYPKDDPKEAQRWKAEQITPNSVRIGDTWYSLNYFGPVGLLFNAGNNYVNAKGASAQEKAGSAIAGLGQGLLGQSFLQGFSGFSDAISDPNRSAKSFVNSEAASTVPSWLNDVANVTDKFQRQADTVGESVKNRIPGLREDNKIKQDVYGNPLEQPAGKLNTLNGMKPSDSRTGNNEVLSEVSRLHAADPNNSDLQVTPSPVGKTVKVNKQDISLDNNQRYELQKRVGQFIQSKWGDLIKTDAYKSLDDAGKAKALTNLRTDAQTLATREYVVEKNLGAYDKGVTSKQAALASGGDIAGYATASGIDDKKLYSEPDYEYKTMVAKYEDDKKAGTLSRAEDIRRQTDLQKAKVGSKFSKDTRDFYGLSKSQIYELISNDPDGKRIADEVLAYGDALQNAGLSDNKFRTKAGAVSFAPTALGGGNGSGSSNRYALFGSGGAGGDVNSMTNSLRNMIKKARLA